MPAGSNVEVRSIGCAVHSNSVQAAGILSGRRENPANALNRSQVCIIERIGSTHLGVARAICPPRSKRSARRNVAQRLRVDQVGFKLKRLAWTNTRHLQSIDVKL